MTTTFWGTQSPTDRTLQNKDEPTEVLMSADVLLPDRLRMPEGSPQGIAGTERRVEATMIYPCWQCEQSSPWHLCGALPDGRLLLVVQCQGECGWLVMDGDPNWGDVFWSKENR